MVASTIDFDEFAMETLSDVGGETLAPIGRGGAE